MKNLDIIEVDSKLDSIVYAMSAVIPQHWHKCDCCGRDLGLPNGSRGLCDACDEDIPNHVPKEQYVTYMKELWRKR